MKSVSLLLTVLAALAFASEAGAEELHRAAAMWVYETDALVASPAAVEELIAFCRPRRIVDLFWATHYAREGDNAAPAYHVPNTERVRNFLAQANAAGLRIHALSGEPDDALPERRARLLARVQATIAFNEGGAAAQRFAGIHLDIEPHALPAWKRASAAEKCALLTQLVEAHAAAVDLVRTHAPQLLYGADVVFWLDKQNPDGTPVYPVTFRGGPGNAASHLLALADNLAIMSYRSFAEGQNGLIALTRRTVEEADHSHGRVFIGVKMANIGPPLETFYGQPEAKMQEAVRAVDEACAGHRGYAGAAYFTYAAYREMVRGAE